MALQDSIVKISVGQPGQRREIEDWLSYEVESAVREPADAFNFKAANLDGALAGAVAPGDPVEVMVDDELIKVGAVDDVDYEDVAVGITGRDLFGQLVDCSAPLKTYNNVTLLQLAQDLTAEWGIDWSGIANTTPIRKVKIEPGETFWEVLLRLANKEQVALWMDADGEAQIGKPNYTQPPLYKLYRLAPSNPLAKSRNNVLPGATVRQSWRDVHSPITVYGSAGNTKLDYGSSSRWKADALEDIGQFMLQVAQGKYNPRTIGPTSATAAATGIQRPLRIVDGDCKTKAKAQARAERELQKRRFEALTLTYTVPGHYGYLGDKASLWAIDTMCEVEDEVAGQSGTFYVSRVRFSSPPRTTTVELHPAGAWLP